ncbi:hypothetical protein INT45_010364 [Circinella minor]|uniref:Uncharacterized protein n=1 Tax=Circinella minor TaxID=1195481 RepID=A0A8H7SC48_9FUNG|nr:hypothetical protein INT45_010364 [Circinella minor]
MQATGSRSPAQIFQALINYAQPVVTHHQQNRLESPIKQGGGLVQIHNAIEGQTSVSPYKLELNDTQFFEPEKLLYIKNKSPVQRIYYLEHQPAAAIAGYDFSKSAVPRYRPLHVNANATVQFEYTEVTIEPNSTQSIHIRFNPPSTDLSTTSPRYRYYYKHLLYGGYIKISSIRKNQKDLDNKEVEEIIHVPYMGALDNQRDLPIFDTVKGYPRIEPTNKTAFSFRHRNDLLYLHIRLGNPTARLRTVLVNQENKRLGTLVDGYQKWVSRNDHTDKMYTLEWDGKIILPSSVSSSRRLSTIRSGNSMVNAHHHNYNNNSTRTIDSQQQEKQQHYDKKAVVQRVVPPGRYKIRVSALKIFGDPLLKDDWEIWYSPEFDIV